VGSANADEVCYSAESPVSADKSPQSVALYHPVAVEMSPMVPLSPASFATKAHIHVVGNANKPKLDGIQIKLIRQDLSAKTHECIFNLRASQAAAWGSWSADRSLDGASAVSFSGKSSTSAVSAEMRGR